ncbi:tautomerase enzyme [Streptomyces mirabilis]|uniref:tautomerase enzyme n=1 Tax=Streptomyces mirabilis TaxID=68239 RepID=UPI0036B2E0DB
MAVALTDTVLVSEVGRFASAARIGFQVLFVEREPDMMAIGGRLLAGADREPDVLHRAPPGRAGRRVRAGGAVTGLVGQLPVIDEGGWGSSGGVASILALLASGVFTEEKVKMIRAAIGA